MAEDIDIEGVLDSGHAAPLDADAVPNENQSHYCMSCDEPLVNLYCGNCGQKNDDYRRSLWQLGKEAIASLTAVENRIWRTWAALLFKPGKVAREYADGRRTYWSSPVRVYIFMSILLFGFMEITNTYFFAMELTPQERTFTNEDGEEETRTHYRFQGHFFATEAQTEEWNSRIDFDDLRESFMTDEADISLAEFMDGWNDAQGDDLGWLDLFQVISGIETEARDLTPERRQALIAELRELRSEAQQSFGNSSSPPAITALEELDAYIARQEAWLIDPPEPIPESERQGSTEDANADDDMDIQITGVTGRTYNQDALRELYLDYLRNPAIGNNILNKWLPRIVFLMMPLTMLIGALFIRGRDRRYRFGKKKGLPKRGHDALLFDHLVHAAYIHAVTYMLIFVGIILTRVITGNGAVPLTIIGILLLYLPISLKRMFGRGWIKTIWTAYGVGLIYLIIVLSLTVAAVAIGLEDVLQSRKAFSG